MAVVHSADADAQRAVGLAAAHARTDERAVRVAARRHANLAHQPICCPKIVVAARIDAFDKKRVKSGRVACAMLSQEAEGIATLTRGAVRAD